MRIIKITTAPKYKLDGKSYTFGNLDSTDSKKQPIRIVSADALCPDNNLDELLEWIGGADYIGRAAEALADSIFSTELRKPLLGHNGETLGALSVEERGKLVAQMVANVENKSSIKSYLEVDRAASNATKVNFADEFARLDMNSSDFVSKVMELKAKFGL